MKISMCQYHEKYYDRDLHYGHDPFNHNSNQSDREKWSTSKGEPIFSKLFQLDRTDPLSFGLKFPEVLVEWIAPYISSPGHTTMVIFHIFKKSYLVILRKIVSMYGQIVPKKKSDHSTIYNVVT